MIDEGGRLSCKGDSSTSRDAKTDRLRFVGPAISVVSGVLDRLPPSGGSLAGISCSTTAGDCATIVALRGVDPVETDARRECDGVFGMGNPPGAKSLAALVDFLGDAGLWVNSCVESKLPVFLECLKGSRGSRTLMRRSLEVLREEVE